MPAVGGGWTLCDGPCGGWRPCGGWGLRGSGGLAVLETMRRLGLCDPWRPHAAGCSVEMRKVRLIRGPTGRLVFGT